MSPNGKGSSALAKAVGAAIAMLVFAGLVADGVDRRAPSVAVPRVPAVPTGRGVPAARSAPEAGLTTTTVARLAATPPADTTLIATLRGATTWSAAPGGPPSGTLPATNPYGQSMVVAVIGQPLATGTGWLHVELPIRPNGSSGWIPEASASLTETSYRVAVDVAARTLTVTEGGQPILTTAVAVGKPSTPTPADRTYLWELVRPDDPYGAYGPYVFGLAEFSDAYSTFNGGDAQIGIHGQDEPASIGHAASNGCVRLPNDVMSRLAGLLPLGTPVTIS